VSAAASLGRSEMIVQPHPERLVLDFPGMRLVTLSNGPQWVKFARHSATKKQKKDVLDALFARSLTCPFLPPMDVTITRFAPGTFDDDNLTIAAKAIRDAVAKYVGINDKLRALVSYRVRQAKTKQGIYAVQIEIKPRPEETADGS